MPPSFPIQEASLHDVEVWESLPDDVRASILRLHNIAYFGTLSPERNSLYFTYLLGYDHGKSNSPKHNLQQILSRYFPDGIGYPF
jgi:hypothetical protein